MLVGCGNPEANRALLDAAEKGNIEAVKQHLDAGADVNAKDRGGQTPLDLAIQQKKPETTELLRKHGGKTKKELASS
ncbi:MAG: ankyrin repeat domain-containing protein [Gammaproteobacteria bacterium]|nr:ankyrin repeat domain-containing protein [Gammaproteobacteria bacterium]